MVDFFEAPKAFDCHFQNGKVKARTFSAESK
jgi:hypothetical protein